MEPQLPGNHLSYENHRRQFWLQIFLPMILAILLIIALAILTGLATFGGGGDSARWVAISPYTSKAQYYVKRGASEAKRFSDMATQPVLFLEGLKASLKAIFGLN